jgi:hypothetical protein
MERYARGWVDLDSFFQKNKKKPVLVITSFVSTDDPGDYFEVTVSVAVTTSNPNLQEDKCHTDQKNY